MGLSDNFVVKKSKLKILSFAITVLFFSSCENLKKKDIAPVPASAVQPDYGKKITGEWRNLYTKIVMRSYNNSDSIKVMEIREEDWEQVMKVKPIRTFFKEDGTYNSEHRNLNDSVVYHPAGRWCIEGDSLFMTDTFPQKGISYKYKIAIDNDIAEFTGVEDFDRDGLKDDAYYGTQRRQK